MESIFIGCLPFLKKKLPWEEWLLFWFKTPLVQKTSRPVLLLSLRPGQRSLAMKQK